MKKIDITHKNLIEKIRSDYGHTLSSHSFVSLYLWQEAMDLSLICSDDFYTAKCGMEGDDSWFFPCGDERKIYEFIAEHMSNKKFSMCYLRECDVDWINLHFPDKWNFFRTEESDEYICDVSACVSLEGGKFSEIRKKIRKLDKNYDIRVCKISESTLKDAMEVFENWYEAEHSVGKNGLTDDLVAEKALNERELLDVDGVILYEDNRPVSVFGGFPLSEDTVDVLIGKSISHTPAGTAYYALREYLRICEGKYKYCNLEEDLGIEGIRQMKSRLHPIEKTPIWEAVLK